MPPIEPDQFQIYIQGAHENQATKYYPKNYFYVFNFDNFFIQTQYHTRGL